MSLKKRTRAGFAAMLFLSVAGLATPNASAVTNQFRGVNWGDARDNFQSGILYVSGLSSSDTYASAFAVGDAIMSQFVSKVGANAVRLPINEATVSQYWSTYTGAIDAVLAKGMVVFCYWDSAKSNKPPDMNAFWNMWKTVVDKYGGNDKAYFEVFNEPNMYSKTDLRDLYYSWLTRFSTIPKGRVILDGTGNAQNVPDVGGDSRLDGCLLAVHDYSFFGSESMTSESQWADHIKGSVGSYADRTLCTEWGGPMSPGSKNGKSYDYLDYSKSPSNYFEAYIRGISSQLRSWNMGSFYWPGLRDGDWYSMTIKNGSGANITLSIPNQSGLDRLHYAWTGPAPNADAGAGGTSGRDGAAAGDAGGAGGDSGPATGGAGGVGGAGSGTGGAGIGTGGAGGVGGTGSGTGGAGGMGGTVASGGVGGGSSTASGGTPDSGVPSGSGGKAPSGGSIASGGRLGAGGSMAAGGSASGGSGAGGAGGASTRTNPDVESSAGCSCGVGATSGERGWPRALLLGALVALIVRRRLRARPVGLDRH
jgi:hypothetical protein